MTTDVARRAVCLGLTTTVTACGFHPIYMPTASGKPGVAQRELASVFVPIIPDRPGQLLRQALQQRFGDDSGTPASYDLKVSFSVAGEGIGIESNNIATRLRLTGNASWSLLGHDPKQTVLTSGNARVIDGLNIFDAEYFASDLETEAVQARIAENIAQQITNQLAIWFRNHAGDNQTG